MKYLDTLAYLAYIGKRCVAFSQTSVLTVFKSYLHQHSTDNLVEAQILGRLPYCTLQLGHSVLAG